MPNNPTPSAQPMLAVPSAETAPPTTPVARDTNENWQEFLEEDADCCGGCNHKVR